MTMLNVDELIDHFLIQGEMPCAVVGGKMATARRATGKRRPVLVSSFLLLPVRRLWQTLLPCAPSAGVPPARPTRLDHGDGQGEGLVAKEALTSSTTGPGNKDLAAYCVAYFDAVTILSKRGKFLCLLPHILVSFIPCQSCYGTR
jgi:hypothetical protein